MRQAVVAIIQGTYGYYLAVKRLHRGEVIWTFPGGKVEPGETPNQAVRREVMEEVGISFHPEVLIYSQRVCGEEDFYTLAYLGSVLDHNAKPCEQDWAYVNYETLMRGDNVFAQYNRAAFAQMGINL